MGKSKLLKKIISAIAAGLVLVMSVQIVLGIIWMINNFTTIPEFGDSAEYINLSTNLVVDEFRTIAFPLLLKILIKIEHRINIPFQSMLYSIQTILCYIGIYYSFSGITMKLFAKFNRKNRIIIHVFVSLYVLCIPMIMFMNLTVLTDSLALSFGLLFLGALIRISDKSYSTSKLDYVVYTISLFGECLARADRIYSCSIFVILFFIIQIIRKRKEKSILIMLVLTLLMAGAAIGINKKTQQPGAYGRIPISKGFVLLDRVVWPNMTKNYEYFPQEIKKIIPQEETVSFDNQNNNARYVIAPMIVQSVGEEKAEVYYKEMAKVVWEREKTTIVGNIIRDTGCMIDMPLCSYLSNKGKVKTNRTWNMHCMSARTEKLTHDYDRYYVNTFMVIKVLSIVLFCVLLLQNETRGMGKIVPYIWMCILIALWFSVGAGAPPNDRYALLDYAVWGFLVVLIWIKGIAWANETVRKDSMQCMEELR